MPRFEQLYSQIAEGSEKTVAENKAAPDTPPIFLRRNARRGLQRWAEELKLNPLTKAREAPGSGPELPLETLIRRNLKELQDAGIDLRMFK